MPEIQKGIPLPKPREKGMAETLRAMDVGDSFYWPKKQFNTGMLGRIPGQFTSRKEGDGVRVWRVE